MSLEDILNVISGYDFADAKILLDSERIEDRSELLRMSTCLNFHILEILY